MASLIKNQIVKHLSAFARNLKPEQISVEVLRGKGQLRNLELNEEVLSERLELPPWLAIVKAECTGVSVKIPWTKIKSAPVQLFVEEIRVVIRLVAPSTQNMKKGANLTSKNYDLSERVLEGISMNVQSIELYFETESGSAINFGGSIMISHLVLESRAPNWHEWPDGQDVLINMTRIHDKVLRHVLFFKHVSWRVLKIEASSFNHNSNKESDSRPSRRSALNSPLRFLTENGRCRITIKKSTSDCSLIAGRIELILEEIHWLAYMAHLRSAIEFYKHILELSGLNGKDVNQPIYMQQNQLSDLQRQQQKKTLLSAHGALENTSSNHSHLSTTSNVFRKFDITQSSHHLIISRIDLHLCDDSSLEELPADWNIESGAMQATVHKLHVDYYPRHQVFEGTGQRLTCSTRSNWLRYTAPNSFTQIANMQLEHHFQLLINKLEPNARERFERIWPQLTSGNFVVRMENLIIQAVSERTTKKGDLRRLFGMDNRFKDRMPKPISFVHLEVTIYSFPATNAYPVPPDSVHLILAPFELVPDTKSLRWLVYAFENILNSFDTHQPCPEKGFADLPESRIELIMPKIVLQSSELLLHPSSNGKNKDSQITSEIRLDEAEKDARFPKRFIVSMSTAIFTNYVLPGDNSMSGSPFLPVNFLQNTTRPSDIDFYKFDDYKNLFQNIPASSILERKIHNMSRKELEQSADESNGSKYDRWLFSVPALWVNCDFGEDAWELPFLSNLTVFGSISPINDENGQIIGNFLQVKPRSDIGLTLDHFQFVQFLEMVDNLSAVIDQVDSDRQFFYKQQISNSHGSQPLSAYLHCQKIQLRLVLPPGPTPSPYDLKSCALKQYDFVTPSNTSLSSQDIQNDEPAKTVASILSSTTIPIKNTTTISPADPFLQNQTSTGKRVLPSRPPPPHSARASLTTENEVEKSGLKTIMSLPRVIDAFTAQEFRVLSSQSDLESNLDETLSITSFSTEQIAFDGSFIGSDCEVFGDSTGVDEIAEAEEALESISEQQKEDIQLIRKRERFLGSDVNVCELSLEDFNFYLHSNEGITAARGFAANIVFDERLLVNRGRIYSEAEERSASPTGEAGSYLNKVKKAGGKEEKIETSESELKKNMKNAELSLELLSVGRQSTVKLVINGVDICLSDDIVSQLSPFLDNHKVQGEGAMPPVLDLIIQNCNIEIKNPKKRFPLRVRLGELQIRDGPRHDIDSGCRDNCG